MSFRILILLVCFALTSTSASIADDGRTDSLSFWVDSDPPIGKTANDYWIDKQFIYNYRDVVVHKGIHHSYFMITGANVTSVEFYGGVQEIYDGRHAVIFSVWDARVKCGNNDCYPDATDTANQAKLIKNSPEATTVRFDHEGNGISTMVYGANWQYEQKIGWLVNQEPADKGTLISAAYRLGDGPWKYIATYYVPRRYEMALTGGYGFIEDYNSPNTPTVLRSMTVGPTIMEDENGNQEVLTNIYIGSSADKNRHKIKVEGDSLNLAVGVEPQSDAKGDYRVRLGKPNIYTDYSGGKTVIQEAISGVTTLPQEKALRDKAKAEAKAAADLKTKLEAEAKAAAELKAKQEAEAKAAADLKAKLEAEAKAKAAKIVMPKKSVITCVKGSTVAKITGINPKCPSGYKKK